MNERVKPTHIFYDLDDTLWSTKYSPLTAAMWERKDHALVKSFGAGEGVGRWMQQAGDTDAGVLLASIKALPPEKILSTRFSSLEMVPKLLEEMCAYYGEHSPSSISSLLFEETIVVLDLLFQKYKLGIVSGNDSTPWFDLQGVGDYKLKQAGLTKYFPDVSMNFWGGNIAMNKRADLLLAAHRKTILDNGGSMTPLVYIADSKGDARAVAEMMREYHKPIDVRFGWMCRSLGQLSQAIDYLVHDLGLLVGIDMEYLNRYDGSKNGSVFRVDFGQGKNLIIHTAPDMRAFLNDGGILN